MSGEGREQVRQQSDLEDRLGRATVVRISSFTIRNYKGIALAEMDSLAAEPVITISGRNGTGKSLLLEALVGAWAGRYDMRQRVGPWANELLIAIGVHLTPNEWDEMSLWHQRLYNSPLQEDALTFELRADLTAAPAPVETNAVRILRDAQFQKEHRFGVIDFLPANRLVPSVPTASVDLAMLTRDRVEQERYQMLDQFINQRSPVSLPSVSNFLVTLDYQALLASRQGMEATNEYQRLADAFVASTGKTLLEPAYDPVKGSNIEIELQTGHRHQLPELSSGEQEMLAMMYFVRRLSASGGILCIDEPEQHLHPTLQASVFDAMQDLADRAQVFVVSHSVNLIAAAPLAGLVQVSSPCDSNTNQVQRLTDLPGRLELMGSLGISAADLFQSDLLLVVEGDTDAQWLRALFPIELGRAHIVVAGSAKQVMNVHETLSKTPAGLPWLCLRDRDLLTVEELEGLQTKYSHLHVWPRRAIESLFLDPALIEAVIISLGAQPQPGEVNSWLVQSAEPLKDEVLGQLVERRLSKVHPAPRAGTEGDRYKKMELQYREYAEVNRKRADSVAEIVLSETAALESQWADNWQTLVNPKPVMATLVQRMGIFKSPTAMMSALIARARDDKGLRPKALEDLRTRIAELLHSTSPYS